MGLRKTWWAHGTGHVKAYAQEWTEDYQKTRDQYIRADIYGRIIDLQWVHCIAWEQRLDSLLSHARYFAKLHTSMYQIGVLVWSAAIVGWRNLIFANREPPSQLGPLHQDFEGHSYLWIRPPPDSLYLIQGANAVSSEALLREEAAL